LRSEIPRIEFCNPESIAVGFRETIENPGSVAAGTSKSSAPAPRATRNRSS